MPLRSEKVYGDLWDLQSPQAGWLELLAEEGTTGAERMGSDPIGF